MPATRASGVPTNAISNTLWATPAVMPAAGGAIGSIEGSDGNVHPPPGGGAPTPGVAGGSAASAGAASASSGLANTFDVDVRTRILFLGLKSDIAVRSSG